MNDRKDFTTMARVFVCTKEISSLHLQNAIPLYVPDLHAEVSDCVDRIALEVSGDNFIFIVPESPKVRKQLRAANVPYSIITYSLGVCNDKSKEKEDKGEKLCSESCLLLTDEYAKEILEVDIDDENRVIKLITNWIKHNRKFETHIHPNRYLIK